MKIYLLTRDRQMMMEWKSQFFTAEDVDVVLDDFDYFMDKHKVQCIVSPANSYGIIDGGYDAAITNYLGEQPVGSSFIIVIPAFGAATGKVSSIAVAELMKSAYDQIKNPPKELNWDVVI